LPRRQWRAGLILDFLRHNDADAFFLVGDLIGSSRMRVSFYWPQSQNESDGPDARAARRRISRPARSEAPVVRDGAEPRRSDATQLYEAPHLFSRADVSKNGFPAAPGGV